MKFNQLFLLGVLTLCFTSCFTSQQASFYKAPGFNSNSTFKVITLNTNDAIAGRIEHYLLTNNFRVISDNSFRLPGNTAFPNTAYPNTAYPNQTYPNYPRDTSRYSNTPLVVNIPYMEDHPADYIIRYQFDNPPLGASEDAKSSLNISVVNTQTGEVEISYLSQQKGRLEQPKLDRVILDFVNRLKSR